MMPLALAVSRASMFRRHLAHAGIWRAVRLLRKSDLERGLERIDFLTSAERSDALRLMQRFYNGYRFVGAAEPLYWGSWRSMNTRFGGGNQLDRTKYKCVQ
jgi:hypothetical protein